MVNRCAWIAERSEVVLTALFRDDGKPLFFDCRGVVTVVAEIPVVAVLLGSARDMSANQSVATYTDSRKS